MQKIICLIFVAFLIGCADAPDQSKEEVTQESVEDSTPKPTLPIPHDSVLINSVQENLDGLNNEDIAWAMGPLHSNSPYMIDPAYHIRGSFLVYEMEFKLHDVQIEHKSDTACIALVEHDSRNYNERTYTPARSTQRYTWKPDNGEWKIWKMEILGSSPLRLEE